MSFTHIEQAISALKQGTQSIDSQIFIIHWLRSNGYNPTSEGMTRSTIEDELNSQLNHTVATSLSHLEDINFVEEYLKQDVTYIIAEWHPDVFVMGMVDEAAAEGIEALIADLEPPETQNGQAKIVTDGSGRQLRGVVADAFDLYPGNVEAYLRDGDQVDRLNHAVEAIEESELHEVGDGYGKIVFRNPAYRYRLTETANRLYIL